MEMLLIGIGFAGLLFCAVGYLLLFKGLKKKKSDSYVPVNKQKNEKKVEKEKRKSMERSAQKISKIEKKKQQNQEKLEVVEAEVVEVPSVRKRPAAAKNEVAIKKPAEVIIPSEEKPAFVADIIPDVPLEEVGAIVEEVEEEKESKEKDMMFAFHDEKIKESAGKIQRKEREREIYDLVDFKEGQLEEEENEEEVNIVIKQYEPLKYVNEEIDEEEEKKRKAFETADVKKRLKYLQKKKAFSMEDEL